MALPGDLPVSYHEMSRAVSYLGLNRAAPLLAHASLSAFGPVRGGAGTLLGALLGAVDTLLMPAFTFKTMLIPETGPENNGIEYGTGADANRLAEFFRPDMLADRLMGIVPETLRNRAGALRSNHPILSFTGIGPAAADALRAQTLDESLAPVRVLAEQGGWVLLAGVNHTVNTTIHYAEALAGRRAFTRWALTPSGVRECPGYPGCSDGFQALAGALEPAVKRVAVGKSWLQAVPMQAVVEAACAAITADPLALLCGRAECPRCDAVRSSLQG